MFLSWWNPLRSPSRCIKKDHEKRIRQRLDKTQLERDYDLVRLSKCLGLKSEERQSIEDRIEKARIKAEERARDDVVQLNYCDSDGSLVQATFYDDDAGDLALDDTLQTLEEMESFVGTLKKEEATLQRDIYKCGLGDRYNVVDGISYGVHRDADDWICNAEQKMLDEYGNTREPLYVRCKHRLESAMRWLNCYLFNLLAHIIYVAVLKTWN